MLSFCRSRRWVHTLTEVHAHPHSFTVADAWGHVQASAKTRGPLRMRQSRCRACTPARVLAAPVFKRLAVETVYPPHGLEPSTCNKAWCPPLEPWSRDQLDQKAETYRLVRLRFPPVRERPICGTVGPRHKTWREMRDRNSPEMGGEGGKGSEARHADASRASNPLAAPGRLEG